MPKVLYNFDFSNCTALDMANLLTGKAQDAFRVIDKTIVGGLSEYKPDELEEITHQFAKRWEIVFMSNVAKAINSISISENSK